MRFMLRFQLTTIQSNPSSIFHFYFLWWIISVIPFCIISNISIYNIKWQRFVNLEIKFINFISNFWSRISINNSYTFFEPCCNSSVGMVNLFLFPIDECECEDIPAASVALWLLLLPFPFSDFSPIPFHAFHNHT